MPADRPSGIPGRLASAAEVGPPGAGGVLAHASDHDDERQPEQTAQ